MKIKTSNIIIYSIIIILLYILFNKQSSGFKNPFLRPNRKPITKPTTKPNVSRGTNNRFFKKPSAGLLSL